MNNTNILRMKRVLPAADLVVITLGAGAQPPAGPPVIPPASPAATGTGTSIVPHYDLDRTTDYSLKIKGVYSIQSSEALLETPVEVNCDLRVAVLAAPTEAAEGVIEIEFVAVRYFANEKFGNITFDSTKPPRPKPNEQDRSKAGPTEPSREAAEELFKKIVGSRVLAHIDQTGRVTRYSGDENLAARPNVGPYVPSIAGPLRLLLGPAWSNTSPGFKGSVQSRQSWSAQENIGTKDKPTIVETGYEVRSMLPSRVEIVTLGRLKSDTPASNQLSHTVESRGVIVWDPKAGQLISARVSEQTARADSTTTRGTIKRSEKWETALQRGATVKKTGKAAPASPASQPATK